MFPDFPGGKYKESLATKVNRSGWTRKYKPSFYAPALPPGVWAGSTRGKMFFRFGPLTTGHYSLSGSRSFSRTHHKILLRNPRALRRRNGHPHPILAPARPVLIKRTGRDPRPHTARELARACAAGAVRRARVPQKRGARVGGTNGKGTRRSVQPFSKSVAKPGFASS